MNFPRLCRSRDLFPGAPKELMRAAISLPLAVVSTARFVLDFARADVTVRDAPADHESFP